MKLGGSCRQEIAVDIDTSSGTAREKTKRRVDAIFVVRKHLLEKESSPLILYIERMKFVRPVFGRTASSGVHGFDAALS